MLLDQYPASTTLTSSAFAASGYGNGQSFIILLLLEVTGGAASRTNEVWLLTGPIGEDASSWRVGGTNMSFKKLVYDAVSTPVISGITASNLNVTSLNMEFGLSATDPMLNLATVADPNAPGELRCFLLNPAAAGGSDAPIWSYYQQEQDIGVDTLQLSPGRLSSDPSAWGLYKLYSLNNNPSLTYLSTQGSFGHPDAILFAVPDVASAIASLVFQPQGDSVSSTYSDPFVAGSGSIYYFPYTKSSHMWAYRL